MVVAQGVPEREGEREGVGQGEALRVDVGHTEVLREAVMRMVGDREPVVVPLGEGQGVGVREGDRLLVVVRVPVAQEDGRSEVVGAGDSVGTPPVAEMVGVTVTTLAEEKGDGVARMVRLAHCVEEVVGVRETVELWEFV